MANKKQANKKQVSTKLVSTKQTSTKRALVTVPAPWHRAAKQQAAREGVTLSALLYRWMVAGQPEAFQRNEKMEKLLSRLRDRTSVHTTEPEVQA